MICGHLVMSFCCCPLRLQGPYDTAAELAAAFAGGGLSYCFLPQPVGPSNDISWSLTIPFTPPGNASDAAAAADNGNAIPNSGLQAQVVAGSCAVTSSTSQQHTSTAKCSIADTFDMPGCWSRSVKRWRLELDGLVRRMWALCREGSTPGRPAARSCRRAPVSASPPRPPVRVFHCCIRVPSSKRANKLALSIRLQWRPAHVGTCQGMMDVPFWPPASGFDVGTCRHRHAVQLAGVVGPRGSGRSARPVPARRPLPRPAHPV